MLGTWPLICTFRYMDIDVDIDTDKKNADVDVCRYLA